MFEVNHATVRTNFPPILRHTPVSEAGIAKVMPTTLGESRIPQHLRADDTEKPLQYSVVQELVFVATGRGLSSTADINSSFNSHIFVFHYKPASQAVWGETFVLFQTAWLSIAYLLAITPDHKEAEERKTTVTPPTIGWLREVTLCACAIVPTVDMGWRHPISLMSCVYRSPTLSLVSGALKMLSFILIV